MTKLSIIVAGCFVVAFAAGTGVGLVLRGRPEPPSRHSTLERDLGLTPKQAEQVKAIWSETWQALHARPGERRESVEKEREDAIRSLLTQEEAARYDQIQAEFRRKLEKMGEERRAVFDGAVQRTKEILTDAQRAKYEALLEQKKAMGGPSGGPGHFRGPRGGPRGAQPAPPPPEKQP